jgi:hypothetical protein
LTPEKRIAPEPDLNTAFQAAFIGSRLSGEPDFQRG